MDKLFLIIAAVLAVVFAYGIAQNMRNIEYLIKQDKAIAESVSNNRKQLENLRSGHNTAVDIYDKDISDIVAKLEQITREISKLDAMETRIRQADAKASEAEKMMILNGFNAKENGGVPWAKYQVCKDDMGECDG